MGADTYGTHGIKNPKKRMTTEFFEYNNKLSGVKYSPQQPFSNIYYRQIWMQQMNVTIVRFKYFIILSEFCDGQSN